MQGSGQTQIREQHRQQVMIRGLVQLAGMHVIEKVREVVYTLFYE